MQVDTQALTKNKRRDTVSGCDFRLELLEGDSLAHVLHFVSEDGDREILAQLEALDLFLADVAVVVVIDSVEQCL